MYKRTKADAKIMGEQAMRLWNIFNNKEVETLDRSEIITYASMEWAGGMAKACATDRDIPLTHQHERLYQEGKVARQRLNRICRKYGITKAEHDDIVGEIISCFTGLL